MQLQKEHYIQALGIIYNNLLGNEWDNRPLSREFTLKLCDFIEQVFNGKTPEQIILESKNLS